MKVGWVVLGIIVLLFVGLNLLVRSYLSSERLKAMILPQAEALTGRKVNLEEINVSLFRGVVARGLSIKEMDGQRDFLKLKEFVLSYRLLPLLQKQFIITKIEIISPFLTVLKDRQGKYNVSSLLERASQKPSEPLEPKSQGLPVAVVTDRIFVKDLQFKFVDEGKEMPEVFAALDMKFTGAVGKDGTPHLTSGEISIREIKTALKGAEIIATGKINLKEQTIHAHLKTSLGKDRLELTATVKDYLKTPEVTANLYAKELDLEKWMGLTGDKETPVKTVPQKPGRLKEKESRPPAGGTDFKGKVSGQVKVEAAKYQGYLIKNISVNFRYLDGNLKMEPLGLEFSGGEVYKTDGHLRGKLQLASAKPKETLKGELDLKLGKGVIKDSKIFNAISSLTGLQALKEPVVEEGSFRFDLKEEKVYIDGWIRSDLFHLVPKGYLGFDQRLDIPSELKLSPELSKGFSKGLGKWKFLSDEKGWTAIPLKIKGTTDKPEVTLDTEKLAKQMVPEFTREIEKRLFQKKQ